MAEHHKLSVLRIIADLDHSAAARGAHRRADDDRDVEPGVRFFRSTRRDDCPRDVPGWIERPVTRQGGPRFEVPVDARQAGPHRGRQRERIGHGHRIRDDVRTDHFPKPPEAPFGAVERGREFPHLRGLRLEPRHIFPQARYARGGLEQRSVQRAQDQRPSQAHDTDCHQDAEEPDGHPERARLELPVSVHHDRDAGAWCIHPSNGAPRMSSSRRARSSFE